MKIYRQTDEHFEATIKDQDNEELLKKYLDNRAVMNVQ